MDNGVRVIQAKGSGGRWTSMLWIMVFVSPKPKVHVAGGQGSESPTFFIYV